MKTLLKIILFSLFFATISSCKVYDSILSGFGQKQKVDTSVSGYHYLVHEVWDSTQLHNLRSVALPQKIVMTSLALYASQRNDAEVSLDLIRPLLEEYGWFYPSEFANAPDLKLPPDGPLGMVFNRADFKLYSSKLEVMNTGCAACHAGRLYDEHGNPTDKAWLGAGNTSINFEGYIQLIYDALMFTLDRYSWKEFTDMMVQLFPQTSARERLVINMIIKEQVYKNLRDNLAPLGRGTPFYNGFPGITNGVASFKNQTGLIKDSKKLDVREVGYTSIPDLSERILRSSFLYDGSYSPTESMSINDRQYEIHRSSEQSFLSKQVKAHAPIVSAFTIPTMGNSIKTTIQQHSKVEKVLEALYSNYKPPRFPGKLNYEGVQAGFIHYQKHCQSCHGTYKQQEGSFVLQSFPNRLVPLAEIGTDPFRSQLITESMVQKINHSDLKHYFTARFNNGYVAPILNGIWYTAPYLHNGSIPTLWHFFNPKERPKRFMVGGHKLDYQKVGLAGHLQRGAYVYEPDYKPFATPVLIDTDSLGMSNKGHERQIEQLSSEEKWEIMEFLKSI